MRIMMLGLRCKVCTCTTASLMEFSICLSTSDGSESSSRIFGPCLSGPNAQMDLAARTSQSYLVWKNSPRLLSGQSMLTCPDSMSSASPCKTTASASRSRNLLKADWPAPVRNTGGHDSMGRQDRTVTCHTGAGILACCQQGRQMCPGMVRTACSRLFIS